MKTKPKTITPDTSIEQALMKMNKTKINILPVVENKLFIGIIQKKNLIQYELNENKTNAINLLNNYERVIGNYHSNNKKTIIFIAAIHGNENSGVIALKRFFKEIQQSPIKIDGAIIGLIGNLTALKNNTRHIDIDMNRLWTDRAIQSRSNQEYSERKEVLRLKELIEKIIILKKKKNITIVDLHSTSSPNGVFSIVNNLKEKKIAEHLKIPIINNLLKQVKGSFAEYYSNQKINTIVFEGGAIEDPASINNHEVGIWRLLEQRGLIDENLIPQRVLKNNLHMNSFSEKTKGYYFVKHIHKIKEGDDFLMYPNMRNFEKVEKGQVIGSDNNGPVKSPHNGRLLMPLYQKQGKEGFYLINKFK